MFFPAVGEWGGTCLKTKTKLYLNSIYEVEPYEVAISVSQNQLNVNNFM